MAAFTGDSQREGTSQMGLTAEEAFNRAFSLAGATPSGASGLGQPPDVPAELLRQRLQAAGEAFDAGLPPPPSASMPASPSRSTTPSRGNFGGSLSSGFGGSLLMNSPSRHAFVGSAVTSGAGSSAGAGAVPGAAPGGRVPGALVSLSTERRQAIFHSLPDTARARVTAANPYGLTAGQIVTRDAIGAELNEYVAAQHSALRQQTQNDVQQTMQLYHRTAEAIRAHWRPVDLASDDLPAPSAAGTYLIELTTASVENVRDALRGQMRVSTMIAELNERFDGMQSTIDELRNRINSSASAASTSAPQAGGSRPCAQSRRATTQATEHDSGDEGGDEGEGEGSSKRQKSGDTESGRKVQSDADTQRAFIRMTRDAMGDHSNTWPAYAAGVRLPISDAQRDKYHTACLQEVADHGCTYEEAQESVPEPQGELALRFDWLEDTLKTPRVSTWLEKCTAAIVAHPDEYDVPASRATHAIVLAAVKRSWVNAKAAFRKQKNTSPAQLSANAARKRSSTRCNERCEMRFKALKLGEAKTDLAAVAEYDLVSEDQSTDTEVAAEKTKGKRARKPKKGFEPVRRFYHEYLLQEAVDTIENFRARLTGDHARPRLEPKSALQCTQPLANVPRIMISADFAEAQPGLVQDVTLNRGPFGPGGIAQSATQWGKPVAAIKKLRVHKRAELQDDEEDKEEDEE